MSVSIRRVLIGFDRFSVILRGAYAKHNGVLVQWLPDTEECIAIAAVDDVLGETDPGDYTLLLTWSESFPPRVPADAIRLLAPSLDPAEIGEFTLSAWLRVWERVIDTTATWVEQGIVSSDAMLIDGLWLALEINELPCGGFVTDPATGAAAWVTEYPDGTGRRESWAHVVEKVGAAQASRMYLTSRGIAQRVGGTQASGGGLVVSLADHGTEQPAPRDV